MPLRTIAQPSTTEPANLAADLGQVPVYSLSQLPVAVRRALYNLTGEAQVPGDQLVFYAFNHGDTAAMSFASGLPLVCLNRALTLRGWRPKSLSLLRSVVEYRWQ